MLTAAVAMVGARFVKTGFCDGHATFMLLYAYIRKWC